MFKLDCKSENYMKDSLQLHNVSHYSAWLYVMK